MTTDSVPLCTASCRSLAVIPHALRHRLLEPPMNLRAEGSPGGPFWLGSRFQIAGLGLLRSLITPWFLSFRSRHEPPSACIDPGVCWIQKTLILACATLYKTLVSRDRVAYGFCTLFGTMTIDFTSNDSVSELFLWLIAGM